MLRDTSDRWTNADWEAYYEALVAREYEIDEDAAYIAKENSEEADRETMEVAGGDPWDYGYE